METVRCNFDISKDNLEKCRHTYQGNKIYAFPMSEKYIMALYTYCLVTREEAVLQEIRGIYRERVRNGKDGECRGCIASGIVT